MTKEQKIEAYAMRLDGVSLQGIADHFGVSKQYIHQLLPGARRSNKKKYESYIYPNIVKFLRENNVSAKHLAELCDITNSGINHFLSGKSGGSKTTIDKILAVTGMTYEEAFAKEDSNEA